MASYTDLLDKDQYTDEQGNIDYDRLIKGFPYKFSNVNKQAVRVPNSAEPGKFSSIYASPLLKNELIHNTTAELDTALKLFEKTAELYPHYTCVASRLKRPDGTFDTVFTPETYQQVNERRKHVGSGIKNLIGHSDEEQLVSVFAPNRAEWILVSLGAQSYSLSTTSLYDTLGPTTSKYILNFTKSPILFTTYDKLITVLDLADTPEGPDGEEKGLPHLKYLVCFEPLDLNKDFGIFHYAESKGVRLLDFNHLEHLGKTRPIPLRPAAINSTIAISFTSGTTGNPKGVVLKQSAVVAAATFAASHCYKPPEESEQLRYYSFLPLAHIYEFINIIQNWARRIAIYFPHDRDPAKLIENLKIVKPHFVALVPRVYTRIEASIKASLSSSFTGRQIIKRIIDYKQQKNLNNESGEIFLLDKVVTKKLKQAIGFDEVKLCISGSAPISAETVNFIKAAFNVRFQQGYGLTESTSGVCLAHPDDHVVSSGGPSTSTLFRLRDIPEMNYSSFDKSGIEVDEPQGELLLKGPQIFEGYYKNKKATDEVLIDGWFYTGDVAKIDKNGRLHIIDRVKNFFKLAQGEYVTPERIENTYLSVASSVVQQIFVYGDSLQTYLVSIIGVDPLAIRSILKRQAHSGRIPGVNVEELLQSHNDLELLDEINNSTNLKRFFLNYVNHLAKDEGLQGFEKIHNFKFDIEPLKIDDGVITPTLKIKRNVAGRFFKESLDKLYAEGSLVKSNL